MPASRTTDLGMSLGSSPGPDITMSLSGDQVTHPIPLLTTFTSLDRPLSIVNELFCLFLSPITHLPPPHYNCAQPAHVFSLKPR